MPEQQAQQYWDEFISSHDTILEKNSPMYRGLVAVTTPLKISIPYGERRWLEGTGDRCYNPLRGSS